MVYLGWCIPGPCYLVYTCLPTLPGYTTHRHLHVTLPSPACHRTSLPCPEASLPCPEASLPCPEVSQRCLRSVLEEESWVIPRTLTSGVLDLLLPLITLETAQNW